MIFSNAAIQWVDDHETLLPKIIASLKPNGQLLIQLPAQHHNATNKMLHELADEEPFHTALHNWKRISPVLAIERYAQILFENSSKSMTAYEKIYPLLLPDSGALFDWTSGTALIPYIEKLHGENRQHFITEFKKRLQQKFATTPVFYPFKRIVLEATF